MVFVVVLGLCLFCHTPGWMLTSQVFLVRPMLLGYSEGIQTREECNNSSIWLGYRSWGAEPVDWGAEPGDATHGAVAVRIAHLKN